MEPRHAALTRWSTHRWTGLALGAVVIGALLGAAPGPAVLAQDGPIDEVGCGVGVSAAAQGVAEAAQPSPAPPIVDEGEGTPIRAVAGITLIPPSAAAAGIATGARSFRTTAGTGPAYLTPFQGGLVFSARQSTRGREPWIAGPTQARRLRDIAPGTLSSSPRDFTPLGELVLFTANDGSHGRELWRTDGTPSGTRMVKDIWRGADGSNPGSLTVFRGRVYFAADDGVRGTELWRTDGTSAGTRLVKDINTDGSALEPGYPGQEAGWAVLDDTLYFPARRRYGELWRTDGTSAGTRRVVPRMILGGPIVVAGDRLYYTGSNDDGGCALDGPFLFTSDGTTAGTRQLTPAKFPWGSLVSYRGRAWLGNMVERANGDISNRPRLWRSSGTNATTVQVRPTVSMDEDTPLLSVGRRLFMIIGGGLAASDERGLNAAVLGDTAGGWRSTPEVVAVGTRWFFPAGRRSVRELWRTEGTPTSTRRVIDVNPRGNDAVGTLVAADGVIWFLADDGIRGRQLWRYVPSSR
jgi:ELWxxDGT repeat protein